MAGSIRIGVGGWTFEPWRGVFFPAGLARSRELAFASRALTSIEINGTYYSTFKPETWRRWREATPDGFVFSVKASRYCTNRKVLAGAGEAVERFLAQGLTELGVRLGPINWQFMPTKRFEPADFAAFLALLPRKRDGIPLRHAVEVRHATFATKAFFDLAQRHEVAIVCATGAPYPEIDRRTAPFTYARLMSSREDEPAGVPAAELDTMARRVRAWARHGDVFVYFISGAKVRNPSAAQALMARIGR